LNSGAAQLAVVQDAQLIVDGEKSDHSKLFSLATMGTFGLLTFPIFAANFYFALKNAPEASSFMGVPILSQKLCRRDARRNPSEAKNQLQLAVVRIQNARGENKGILTIAGGEKYSSTDDLIAQLATTLAAEGSRDSVLTANDLIGGNEILDVGGNPVRYKSPKLQPASTRQNSDVVIVSAPLINDPLLLESVTAASDATIIVASAQAPELAKIQLAIANLHRQGICNLGAIVA